MKINYGKTITEPNELRPFLKPDEPRKQYDSGKYIVAMIYDLGGLKKSFLEGIDRNLRKQNGFAVTRCADDRLWVSEPDKFSLNIDAKITKSWSGRCMREIYHIGDNELIRNGIMRKRGIFGMREIPTYWEIPSVDINGQVNYEAFEKVEPTPVLNVLNSLGYAAEVIPTPQELQEALEKIRAARKSSSGDSAYRHSSDDDECFGLGSLAAGIAIGSALNKD